MSHLSIFRIFRKSFSSFSNINEVLSGDREKESIIRIRYKNLSLAITDCHHSARLMMPIGEPWDGFFYPTLILPIDSYILNNELIRACVLIKLTMVGGVISVICLLSLLC